MNDINNNDNLYNILNVDSNSSIEIIKKAYKKLSLKYHPDKQINSNLPEEQKNINFIKIREAYEILSDPEKKAKYDKENLIKKFSPNNLSEAVDDIKNLFSSREYILFMNILDNKIKQSVLNSCYSNDFLIELKQMNLINILSSINNFKILDIEIFMFFSLKELYNNEYKILNHNRFTKEKFKEAIYPIDKMQIYENEGETFVINKISYSGNFIVKIKIDNNQNYNNVAYQILDNDLYAIISKTFVVNNIIKFIHLDDTTYEYNVDDLNIVKTDFGSLYFIKNMGLPYYNTDNNDEVDVKNCEILRGDLYLLLI